MGRYNHAQPLVIDPILDYSTYLGPNSGATSIAVDSAGEVFVAGYAGPGMPTTTGAYQPSFPAVGKTDPTPVGSSPDSGTAAFVAKFNSAGTALLYCTYLSGAKNDVADAIAVDADGNAYVAGQTASPDFPATPRAFQATNLASNGAGFITELNSSGTGLVYSTFLSGSLAADITGLALDSSDNVYVTGFTADLDFPVTAGAFQVTSPANVRRHLSARTLPTFLSQIQSGHARRVHWRRSVQRCGLITEVNVISPELQIEPGIMR